MSDHPNAYEAVLADLRAKRAELDTAIAAIERVMGVSAAAFSSAGVGTVNGEGAAIREGMFFGLSLTEAAKKYLQTVRRKQSAREIAEALERGGFHHTSKDFPNTVRAIMARNAANEGEFVKLQTDWGLAEWFPGRRVGKGKRDDAQQGVAIGNGEPAVAVESPVDEDASEDAKG